jgi:hypothetical protein
MHEIRRDIEQQVHKHGKFFQPAILPKDIKRGPMGKCFDVCLLHALHNPDLQYVEGIAFPIRPSVEVSPGIVVNDRPQWILHAWLTDAEGKIAYDPTWYATDKDGKEVPPPIVYHGIVMDAKKVGRFVMETEYCCVLENQWRDPALAKEAIGI